MAGTAPVAPRWACLEHRGAWPRDITRHTDPAVVGFAARAAAAGFRLQLIRRPGRRSDDATGCGSTSPTPPRRAPTPRWSRWPDPPTCSTSRCPRSASGCRAGPSPTPCCWCAPTAAATAAAPSTAAPSSRPSSKRASPTSGSAATSAATASPRRRWSCPPATSTAASTSPPPSTPARPPSWARSRPRCAAAARRSPPAGQVADLAVREATHIRCADALTVTGTTVHGRRDAAWRVDVRERVQHAAPGVLRGRRAAGRVAGGGGGHPDRSTPSVFHARVARCRLNQVSGSPRSS